MVYIFLYIGFSFDNAVNNWLVAHINFVRTGGPGEVIPYSVQSSKFHKVHCLVFMCRVLDVTHLIALCVSYSVGDILSYSACESIVVYNH